MSAPGLPRERVEALLEGVGAARGELVELAGALVAVPSVLGQEEPAQAIVAGYLEQAGFTVARVVPEVAAALGDEHGGYPPQDYHGRSSVVGVRRGRAARGVDLHPGR